MTSTMERAQPNLRPDERRTGGTAARAASTAGQTATKAIESPAGAFEHDANGADAIGSHLPPLPRSTGRALARGRRRVRASGRRGPTLVAALTISLLVLGVVALVVASQRRPRGAAERLIQQLERVPARLPVLDS
jgi:hypothetical protein